MLSKRRQPSIRTCFASDWRAVYLFSRDSEGDNEDLDRQLDEVSRFIMSRLLANRFFQEEAREFHIGAIAARLKPRLFLQEASISDFAAIHLQ